MKVVDFTNQIIGNWKVLMRTSSDDTGHSKWKCQCIKCGTVKECTTYNLKRGYPVCDCSRTKRKQQYGSECSNTFIMVDSMVSEMYDLDGNKTLIDTEDILRIKKFYWRKQKSGYWSSKGKIFLHRYIMKCPSGMSVDHINHNRDDHRKCSLRVCTAQQNQFNKRPKIRNTDLPTGVYETPYHKFRASLRTKDIKLHKNFDSLEEAIKQRKDWEQKYIGEYQYKET